MKGEPSAESLAEAKKIGIPFERSCSDHQKTYRAIAFALDRARAGALKRVYDQADGVGRDFWEGVEDEGVCATFSRTFWNEIESAANSYDDERSS